MSCARDGNGSKQNAVEIKTQNMVKYREVTCLLYKNKDRKLV